MRVITALERILADSYALYFKTQNYHWNVVGPEFKSLHLLFEEQYQDLAAAIDEIAERIRMLGAKVPSIIDIVKLSSVKGANINFNFTEMVKDLAHDQQIIKDTLYEGLKVSQNAGDESTSDVIIDRIKIHEKNKWMLDSSV